MSDETTKKPSADEIVDTLSAKLGVDDQEPARPAKPKSDMMSSVGGVFDLGSGAKKKEAAATPSPKPAPKPQPAPQPVDESFEADEDFASEPTPKPVAPKPKPAPAPETKPKAAAKPASKDIGQVAGVFKPGQKSDDLDDLKSSKYLSDEDLGDLEGASGGGSNKIAMFAVGGFVGVIGLIVVLGLFTDMLGPLGHVIRGDFREHKNAEKLRIEEAFRAEQAAKVEYYGNLQINGNPLYATIKLNGQLQFGQTPSGAWRELMVTPTTVIQNLKVTRQTYDIEITSPGFLPFAFKLTEGTWQGDRSVPDKQYMLTANLQPESPRHFEEFSARMAGDVENEYFGKVTIQTQPAGARIKLRNEVALDKSGNELRTPVVGLEKYFVRDKETGKLEERGVRVDSVPDIGEKLELEYPDKADGTRYITAIQRSMWKCTFKDDAEIKRLAKDATLMSHCNYTYDLNMDFTGLERYIAERKAEEERIQKQNEEAQAKIEAGAAKLGE